MLAAQGKVCSLPTKGRMREDAARNRRRILQAAGELLRDDPENVTIPLIAERANISTPTVYRYFPSAPALLSTYLDEVIAQLRDYSHESTETGLALFKDVAAELGRLVEVYGPAMALLRSREGFLHRLHNGDPLIQTVREAWERPIRGVLRRRGIPADHFERALFLYNMMFDPREILDLRETGMTMDEVLDELTTLWLGAIDALANPTA